MAYIFMIIGLVFEAVDYRAGGIDLLPDAMGCLFLLIGFAMRYRNSRFFKGLCFFLIPIFIFSLITAYHFSTDELVALFNISSGTKVNINLLSQAAYNILNLLSFALLLVMIGFLFDALQDDASRHERAGLIRYSEKIGKIYDVLAPIAFIGLAITLFISTGDDPSWLTAIQVTTYLAITAVTALVCSVLWRCRVL